MINCNLKSHFNPDHLTELPKNSIALMNSVIPMTIKILATSTKIKEFKNIILQISLITVQSHFLLKDQIWQIIVLLIDNQVV